MIIRVLPLVLMAAAVAGCSSKDDELDAFIAQVKLEQPGGVEPLPEVKPYDRYVYTGSNMRSPFQPAGGMAGAQAVRPVARRNPEMLESYPLDSLKMVGTMSISGRLYGLVETTDKRVLRVLPGNYVGQNDGRITSIQPARISITEIVPDGGGGFMERGSSLTLKE